MPSISDVRIHSNREQVTPQKTNDELPDEQRTPIAGTPLFIELEGQLQAIAPAALQNDDHVQQLREQIQAAQVTPLFDLRHMLAWTDGERWAILSFVSGTGYQARSEEFGEPSDLFVAVLNGMEGDHDVARCGRGVQAALEVAIIMHSSPQSLPAACSRINQRLADLGVGGYTAFRLQQQAEQLISATRGTTNATIQTLVTVRSSLPDAPGPG